MRPRLLHKPGALFVPKPPRVFHGPFNIAGIPGLLAQFEREAGVDSRAICFPQGVYQRPVDEVISQFTPEFAADAVRSYDIFNFHFGYSLLGETLDDLPFLRAIGKKVFMHFHGCDVRDSKRVLKNEKFSACQACFPMACNYNRSRARKYAERYANATFVSTPDLAEFVQAAQWLPQPIDAATLSSRRRTLRVPTDRPLRVVHAPSARDLKGSVHVEAACARLNSSGVPIDLVLLTNQPHEKVIEAVTEADLVIDQLLIGSYGVFSIEAMALGVPTVCYIRDDLVDKYPPDLPIINANPETIEDTLARIARHRETLAGVGESSHRYVMAHHDVRAVTRRLLEHYNR